VNSGHQLAMGRPLLFLNQGNGAQIGLADIASSVRFTLLWSGREWRPRKPLVGQARLHKAGPQQLEEK
jgi:hypothetical protein